MHRGIGVKAIEKIWQAYGNAMPTVPGWASALMEPAEPS